jgi:peptidoglycan/LPS O-acetylase OafA/YrhL
MSVVTPRLKEMVSDATGRLPGLDIARIVAAIVILFHHLVPLLGVTQGVPHGYLAVDLFFMISGFVVQARYGTHLANGLPASEFIRQRMQRLWPLLVLAGLVSSIETFARLMFGSSLAKVGMLDIGWSALSSFAALPSPVSVQMGHGNWPLNPPLWSLFYELLVGVAFAPWILRARTWLLCIVTSMAGGALAFIVVQYGHANGGVFLVDATLAAARMLFGFGMGALVSRFVLQATKLWTLGFPIATGIVIGALLVPAWESIPTDLIAILAALPSLVWLLTKVPDRLDGIASRLAGELAYAIYVLHWPLLFLLRNVARHLQWMTLDSIGSCLVLGACILLLSVLAVVGFERPVRRWARLISQ